jgi:transposase-like protein
VYPFKLRPINIKKGDTTMKEGITETVKPSRGTYEVLEEMVRLKAQEYIQEILEDELEVFLGRKKSERTKVIDGTHGYRNGHGKAKKFSMMNGTITVRRPRVRGTEERFESRIIPFFKRRSKEVGQLLPELYLHGLAKGDFDMALRGLLGEGAPLSVSSIERLKAKWQWEHEEWKRQELSSLEVVYQWADGIYVKAGLEKEKAALLVIIGALTNGRKVFLACESGYRESKESWSGVLRDLTARGLTLGKLTIADGHLGIWSALGELHPVGKEQRCWNHKIRNVLDSFPKRIRPEAGEYLKRIPYAETLLECERLRDAFADRYRKDYTKAVEKLFTDWDRMVTFYSFPKEHWVHLRTTNVVESPFSSVRLRTDAAKRFKKIQNATAMIWKLLQVAEKNFRTLKGYWLLSDVYKGKRFVDGVTKHDSKTIERMAA